jgi:hypothetical protein
MVFAGIVPAVPCPELLRTGLADAGDEGQGQPLNSLEHQAHHVLLPGVFCVQVKNTGDQGVQLLLSEGLALDLGEEFRQGVVKDHVAGVPLGVVAQAEETVSRFQVFHHLFHGGKIALKVSVYSGNGVHGAQPPFWNSILCFREKGKRFPGKNGKKKRIPERVSEK